MLQICGM